jgi:hypothetical protein
VSMAQILESCQSTSRGIEGAWSYAITMVAKEESNEDHEVEHSPCGRRGPPTIAGMASLSVIIDSMR